MLVRTLPIAVRRALRFHQTHGRLPRLRTPLTFNEKINWRIVHDRRPMLTMTCDKQAVKDYAGKVVPNLVRIPETLWFGTEVAELATLDLPPRWVLKPNNASRLVLVGEGRADPVRLAALTRGWAQSRYWRRNDEWAYRRARPGRVSVEEFIGDGGEPLADLKVLTFDGFRASSPSTPGAVPSTATALHPDWKTLPWTGGYLPGPDVRHERLQEMLRAAAVLASGFDMLRVDFYEHDGVLWFGELTPYPGAGRTRIEPELDLLQGMWWTLPPLEGTVSACLAGPARRCIRRRGPRPCVRPGGG